MAKNYTLKEAANIIAEGKKKDEILEIGRRFPLLAVSLTAVIAKAEGKFLDFINYMPDHITANKINSAMKADIEETEAEADTNDTEEEAPKKVEKKAPTKKSEKKAEADDTDYENMSGAKLLAILKEAGRMKDLRAKGFGIKKPEVLAYLEKYPLDESEAEDEAEAEENGKYDGMNAMELFKECKKRGIKAAPKKPAKFYVDLLTKADETEAEDDGDDEDWDEPEEKPAKKAEKKSEKKAPAKVEKKPIKQTKKPEPEEDEAEDDGDDWDI